MPRLSAQVIDDRKWDAARNFITSCRLWETALDIHGVFSLEERDAYITMKKSQRAFEKARKL